METSEPPGRSAGLLAVLAFGGIVASLTQTLVIPLLGRLPGILDTSASNATWVVTASLLTAAVTTPVAGRLGDLYGKRLVLLGSVVPLTIGSALCAVASSLWPMIIGRGLQGMGMGLIPVGIAALRDLLPPHRLGTGIALISSSLGIGAALGLPMSAAIVEYSDWRLLFWVIAALAVVVGVLVAVVLPRTPPISSGGFDFLGALGLGVALVCLLLAVSKGADWGWTSATTIGLFVVAVVVLLLWGWWELRCSAPLVDLRVTARRQVLLTNLASIVVGASMFAQSLLVPQLLQLPESIDYGLGQSMMAMGLWMAPSGLMMMLVSPIGARLSAIAGPKVTLIVGCVIVAAGYGSSMLLMGTTFGLLAVTVIISIGVGFAYGAMPALVMAAVPASATAAANSFNTLMRSVGTSVASAIVGAVLAQMSFTMGGASVPTENGFRAGLLIGCGAAVVGAVIALAVPGRKAAAGAHAKHGDETDKDTELIDTEVGASDELSTTEELVTGSEAALAPSVEEPALVGTNGAAQQPITVSSRATEFDAAATTVGNGEPAPFEPVSDGPSVYGRVHDARGVAVSGATLTLISMSGQQLARALSSDDGWYELAASEPGSYVLIASGEGRRPDASTTTLGSRPVLCDVTLTTLASLSGTVTRAGDAAPVVGATVAALDLRGEVLASGETDPSGRFVLADLPEGEFTVAVSASGYHPTAVPVQVNSRDTAQLDVVVRPGVRLHGVIRTGNGTPLEDARVTLTDSLGNVVDTVVTGADGAYAFTNLDEGNYTVLASGFDPHTTQVYVGDQDVTGVDVALSHGRTPEQEVAEFDSGDVFIDNRASSYH